MDTCIVFTLICSHQMRYTCGAENHVASQHAKVQLIVPSVFISKIMSGAARHHDAQCHNASGVNEGCY